MTVDWSSFAFGVAAAYAFPVLVLFTILFWAIVRDALIFGWRSWKDSRRSGLLEGDLRDPYDPKPEERKH